MTRERDHISSIFAEILEVGGPKKKQVILEKYKDDDMLRRIWRATYEPHWIYRVTPASLPPSSTPSSMANPATWEEFLAVLTLCRDRKLRGNAAGEAVREVFDRASDEVHYWMQKVLERHLNVGCSVSTGNKVWPGLVSTFECALAKKFETKRIVDEEFVAVEPKLDGVRCLAFVSRDDVALFTRNGKRVTNFDETVGEELKSLVDGPAVFDGELMSADFSAMMGQVFRKTKADASNVVYNVFDWMLRDQWDLREPQLTCQETRERLEDMGINVNCKHVRLIERRIVRPDEIRDIQDAYVAQGIEGTMIKKLGARYCWKRSWDVMKLKDMFSVELEVSGFNEGTGNYKGRLGSFVVLHNGVWVKISRGHMTKDEALHIWENRSQYRGEVIEVGYQEETADGSLRFPEFLRFRRDREKG